MSLEASAPAPSAATWSRLQPLLLLLLIPAAFAVAGLAIRYAAFLSVVPNGTPLAAVQGLCRWDCEWYVSIAESGYDAYPFVSAQASGNWAFFPLVPILVGMLRRLTGMPTVLTGTLTSIVMSYVASLASWPLLKKSLGAYILFSAYMLAGPFSIYFTTFYTEALFVLLTVLTLAALQRRDYLGAGLVTALLSATRVVGVFMALSIALAAVLDLRQREGEWGRVPKALLRRPDIVLGVLLAPLGLFCFMLFLHFWMGDGLAFSHVQRSWARVPGNPLEYLYIGLRSGLKTIQWPLLNGQVLALSGVVGLILTAVLAWQKRWAEALFSALCIVLPLSAGLASLLRFVSALAPIVVLVCRIGGRRWWSTGALLLLLLVGNYFVAQGWVRDYLVLV